MKRLALLVLQLLGLVGAGGCSDPCAESGLGPTGLYPARLVPIGDFRTEAFFQRDGGLAELTASLEFSKDESGFRSGPTAFTDNRLVLAGVAHVSTPGRGVIRAQVQCGERLVDSTEELAEFYPVVVSQAAIPRECLHLAAFSGLLDCDGVVVGRDGAPDPRFVISVDRRVVAAEAGAVRWAWYDGGLVRELPSGAEAWLDVEESRDWVATRDYALIETRTIVDGKAGQLRLVPLSGLDAVLAQLGAPHPLYVGETDAGLVVGLSGPVGFDLTRDIAECPVSFSGAVAGPCALLRAQVVGLDFGGARLLTSPPSFLDVRSVEVRRFGDLLGVEQVQAVGSSVFFAGLRTEELQVGVFANAWAFYQGTPAGGVLAYWAGHKPELVIPLDRDAATASAGFLWAASNAGEPVQTHFADLSEQTIVRVR